MKTKEFQSKNKKISYFKHQRACPLGIEHFNEPTFGLQSVGNALVPTGWSHCNVASFGNVGMHLSVGDKALSMRLDYVRSVLKRCHDRGYPR